MDRKQVRIALRIFLWATVLWLAGALAGRYFGGHLHKGKAEDGTPAQMVSYIAQKCELRDSKGQVRKENAECPIPRQHESTIRSPWGGDVKVSVDRDGRTYIEFAQTGKSLCDEHMESIVNNQSVLFAYRNGVVVNRHTPENDIAESCRGDKQTLAVVLR